MTTDPWYHIKSLARAVVNLDRRLRKLETRAVPMQETVHPVLSTGWTNVVVATGAEPYAAVGYWKSAAGIVVLQGSAQHTGVYPSVMFTLPANYRPATRLSFGVPTYATVDILANGDVYVITAATYVSLDVISFKAEQ